ncbi:MAG: hypothetical protein MK078_10920 [Crocinitomicaceae bacterium]|nr:hypothetical protein [Crocinitomicaceae bacterium]
MYKVQEVKTLLDNEFSGQYLVLINPEKIPHLIVVKNNKYFSLTNKESIINEDFGPYLEKLKRAKRKILFIKLNDSEANLEETFRKYSSVNTDSITCLLPVKESLLKNSDAKFVFELIPELYANNLVDSVYQLNMERDLTELGDFNLNTYSLQDIFNYINHLNKRNDQ